MHRVTPLKHSCSNAQNDHIIMHGWMDGWMDGWMMDGWMDGWMSVTFFVDHVGHASISG